LKGAAPGLLGTLVLNGFNPERSGDVVIIPKPFKFFSTSSSGTTHGSPYNYDTHVPIIFYGMMFKPGRYADAVYITDIVPTLCSVLMLEEPSGCVGKAMTNIIRNRSSQTK
jgi:arylsulfatase A-like enzyme